MSTITADDIVSIVDYFGAAWPWAEWSEQTIAVWVDGLGDPNLHLEGPLAMQVARIVAKRSDRPPSMSTFLSEYRNQQERVIPPPANELESPSNPQQALRLLAAARAAIDGREHNHRDGWEGCAVCVDAVRRQHQHLADGCAICRMKHAEVGPPLPLPAGAEVSP